MCEKIQNIIPKIKRDEQSATKHYAEKNPDKTKRKIEDEIKCKSQRFLHH